MGKRLRVEVEVPARTVAVEINPDDWALAFGVEGEAAIAAEVKEYARGVLEPGVEDVKLFGVFGNGEVPAAVGVVPVRGPSRTSELEFRLAYPRHVAGFDVVHVESWRTGDRVGYASAIVVTRRGETADFCTHRLIFADDQGEGGRWFVEQGHYGIPTLAAALEDARARSV